MYSFKKLQDHNVHTLRKIRSGLRNELNIEIQKRNALMAEIIFLEKEILKYKKEEQTHEFN